MSFSFRIENPKNISAALKRLGDRLGQHNGKLSGDDVKGYITLNGFEGNYAVGSQAIELTVYKKPLPFIPNAMIENEIRKIFQEISAG